MGPRFKKFKNLVLFALICFGPCLATLAAQPAPPGICPRPSASSVVPEPEDLRSQKGVLEVDLTVRNATQADGSVRYCYQYKDGSQSPTLRLHPGDLLVLNLKNEMDDGDRTPAGSDHHHGQSNSRENAGMDSDACASSSMTMTPAATNLHFHGLTIPPVCHQDDVLNTSIGPGSAPFQYKFRIPDNEPPGLYWYHPHIHGFTKAQVLAVPPAPSSSKASSAPIAPWPDCRSECL
jgi:FtsP/CotA-like multicopper oxidase with cupredoxin domain